LASFAANLPASHSLRRLSGSDRLCLISFSEKSRAPSDEMRLTDEATCLMETMSIPTRTEGLAAGLLLLFPADRLMGCGDMF
jgi:hypothetical protein